MGDATDMALSDMMDEVDGFDGWDNIMYMDDADTYVGHGHYRQRQGTSNYTPSLDCDWEGIL